ncbi:hypothetical protein Tco_1558569, partial [Tanacetum coccineum]
MHTSRDNYLINTLRFVSAKKETQIYGAQLPKSMTISLDEPTRKSKRVRRSAKKSSDVQITGVIIRETLVKSLSKKNKKMTIKKHKGIDLLSEVALTEEAQYEEVRKKSLRDFYTTRPSGSGTATKIASSAAKTKPYVTNEGTGAKPGVPYMTEEESTESEAESRGNDEDDSNNDHYSRREGSDQEKDSGDDNTQSDSEKNRIPSMKLMRMNRVPNLIKRRMKKRMKLIKKNRMTSDEDEGMDYTTNQFDDDADVWLNEPVNTDEGLIQNEGIDAEMINKTEVPVISSSHSPD